jgi:hypothetical protein
MAAKRNVVGLGLCLVLGLLILSSAIMQAGEKTYELRPEITLPEYRSDAARAIDAYERTMTHYMSLVERNLTGVNTDVRAVLRKLDSIDAKMIALSVRLARIEEVLGIEPACGERAEPACGDRVEPAAGGVKRERLQTGVGEQSPPKPENAPLGTSAATNPAQSRQSTN